MPGYDLSRFGPALYESLSAKAKETSSAELPVRGPANKKRYVLVRLEEDGSSGHIATEKDTDELSQQLSPSDVPLSPALSLQSSFTDSSDDNNSEARTPRTPPTQQAAHKPGGPCDHCGTLESPQWRRGPAAKPMLCNACGTRYRRTNQLGPPVTAAARCSAAAVNEKKRPLCA
mmetsp:Transcript_19940/g.23911  ORF Transcript_19940/g.23911 Transcript_19940/m.23911 type:complete len:174 (+) Transcript_19940:305-826(+)|eukprot:CAMPEP_0197866752 /NCGR_PEP_ID=MMETSP1438-20131217/44383_1 /TAXON_ID=1461541 /ORGANISM="Pterosperma sp., Strain CCMP1384" /LENGTH=173 /DNA_ID=CAMNT_0043485341 /DNA_START=304 /DNA_END=825 /DNA_ORIENTATION=+